MALTPGQEKWMTDRQAGVAGLIEYVQLASVDLTELLFVGKSPNYTVTLTEIQGAQARWAAFLTALQAHVTAITNNLP